VGLRRVEQADADDPRARAGGAPEQVAPGAAAAEHRTEAGARVVPEIEPTLARPSGDARHGLAGLDQGCSAGPIASSTWVRPSIELTSLSPGAIGPTPAGVPV